MWKNRTMCRLCSLSAFQAEKVVVRFVVILRVGVGIEGLTSPGQGVLTSRLPVRDGSSTL